MPTPGNYTKLQNRLLVEGVHVCAVTGLPTEPLANTLQSGSYFWEGPMVNNHQAVGILVHKSLGDQTVPYNMVLGTANRAVVISVGPCVVQAVYLPFVGKFSTAGTKDFLTRVILNHRRLQDEHKHLVVWTMGDFNLQGLAPRHEHVPRQGSQHQMLSQWMRQLLETNGLQVVRTPATHTGGTTLDVHITELAWKCKAKGYTFPRKFSDHSLSMVSTQIGTQGKAALQTKPQAVYQQVAWSNDVGKWRRAFEEAADLVGCQAKVLQALATSLQSEPLGKGHRTHVANLVTLVVHAVILTIGHANGLTVIIQEKGHEAKGREDAKQWRRGGGREVPPGREPRGKKPSRRSGTGGGGHGMDMAAAGSAKIPGTTLGGSPPPRQSIGKRWRKAARKFKCGSQ